MEDENGVLRHATSHQPQYLYPHQDNQEQLHQDQENLHHIPQTHKPAESCLLPSQPQLDPENEHQSPSANSDNQEEQFSQLQSNQHVRASNSLDAHSHPQSHLEGVFRGSDLVDWLVERGLCAGRAEAQLYGIRLQRGGVIDHLTGQHSFRDIPTLLYHFIQTSDCPRT